MAKESSASRRTRGRSGVRASAAPAPFGYDVVGEDGRRVSRSLPYSEAANVAARIGSATGEQFEIVAADVPTFTLDVTEPGANTDDDSTE